MTQTQSGLYQLQVALLTYLQNVPALTSLLASSPAIFDVPPVNAVYPFILIGTMPSEEWGTRDGGGEKIELSVLAFSNGTRGSGVVKQIGDAVRAALDRQMAAINARLAAGRVVNCTFAGRHEDLSKDGIEWVGTTKFNILLET